jgi:hypothetical protein
MFIINFLIMQFSLVYFTSPLVVTHTVLAGLQSLFPSTPHGVTFQESKFITLITLKNQSHYSQHLPTNYWQTVCTPIQRQSEYCNCYRLGQEQAVSNSTLVGQRSNTIFCRIEIFMSKMYVSFFHIAPWKWRQGRFWGSNCYIHNTPFSYIPT